MNISVPLTELEIFNHLHADLTRPFDALPEYKLKITRFANKTVRFVMYKWNSKGIIKEPFFGETTVYPRTKTDEEKEQARLESVERASRRAKQAVHHLVRSIGADHMLTLNQRENITDVERYDAILKRFIRLVRQKDLIGSALVTRKLKRNWAYVAVREKQERGALHYHIACVGKQDIKLLRACWYVALGGSVNDSHENALGQIDVQYRKKRFSGLTDLYKNEALIGYLTKYISKSFEDVEDTGMRRYKASSEIQRPVISKQYIHSYFSFGEKPFLDAMTELLDIAKTQGVNTGALDYQMFNVGLGLLIMDAPIYDTTPF